jgi:hypothetical protein
MVEVTAVRRYGRVTEARINRLTAECFDKRYAPPLGELIAIEDGPTPLYAVVSSVLTSTIDADRRLIARGEPDHDLDRVLADHPHVPALLLTTFEAVTVGFASLGSVNRYVPSAPAPLLARVRACSTDEIHTLTQSFEFLGLLLEAGPLADEVVAAFLRRAAEAYSDRRAFLVRAGKALTPLLARDPLRLQAILRRMQP